MCLPCVKLNFNHDAGELAQMVERSLSMREVPGSMPGFSNYSQSRNISNSFSSLLIASTVRMAERSKAPDSRGETLSISEHSGPRMWAWVRIPLLTPIFLKVVVPFSFTALLESFVGWSLTATGFAQDNLHRAGFEPAT